MSRAYQANLKLVPIGPWPLGLVNRMEAENTPPNGLLRAKNVDIDAAGVVSTRSPLYEATGTPSDLSRVRAVGGTLISQDTGEIYTPSGRYAILNGTLIQANGGMITGLPGFLPNSLEDERTLIPLPGGIWAEPWHGRVLVISDNILVYSEPLNFGACDPLRNFVMFPEPLTWLAPLDSGVYLATASTVYFLAGGAPEKWVLTQVYGASWRGAGAVIPTQLFGEQALQSANWVAVWFGTKGFVFGLPDGRVVEPQAANLDGLPLATGRIWHFEDRLAVIPMD